MTTSDMMIGEPNVPLWLRVLAAIGVVWYAFGLLQFWLGFTMDTTAAVGLGTITAAHGAAIDGTPGLVWLSFAVASATGLVGALLLFARSPHSKSVLAVSLASALVYYAWVYGLSGTGGDRPAEELGITAVVIAVTLGFTLLSRRMT